jgi:hypothetical protein
MRMAVGTMALAGFLLVACSGPQGPQGQKGDQGPPGRWGQKATRVHQGRPVPQAQAYGS